ncbi:GIT1 protein, partial [Polypterus senegalus]
MKTTPPSAARGRNNKMDTERSGMSGSSTGSRASQFRALSSLLSLFVTLQVTPRVLGYCKSLRMSVIAAIEAKLSSPHLEPVPVIQYIRHNVPPDIKSEPDMAVQYVTKRMEKAGAISGHGNHSMVQTLASNGANSIWEHSLLDPAQVQSGRRKPNPQDKVHPTKSEFIRAKYQMLAFVHKLPCRDDDGVTTKDLSKQLHSSVRTGNLETCLRLLSLGAQANFFHPEKGTTPLHVAAKAGQVLQAELLVVYGADPGAPDINGRTPMDYARQAVHVDLAERLVECQYELTDRLAFYLCGRRPDHKNGHYIIPQMADSLDLSELAKAAKKKLQGLSNRLFEELAMDVYDEVDRRENDAVYLNERPTLLRVGRQKLARFNAREFATLIIDILSDAKRRQHGKGLTSPTDNLDYSPRNHGEADDQHDYDSVASDEDTDQELHRNTSSGRNNRAKSMDSSDLSDGPITLQEYLEVKKALAASEAKVQQLMKVNNNLSDELRRLQREVENLLTVRNQ